MVIRPVQRPDLDALYRLAGCAGSGLTTLPVDRAFLARRIEQARASFEQACERFEADYLFVLVNEHDEPVGITGIAGEVGVMSPWYNYHLKTLTRRSETLGVMVEHQTLNLSDSDEASELCSLFLHPDYRQGFNGRLLSKARFLFLAEFRELFCDRIIAEMRGVSDERGISPFWEHMGRHFFGMEFTHADRLTGLGQRDFIADLIPHEPIYVSMLSEGARSVIGQTHPHTAPARRMLEEEGFRYNNVIDIFDGGPTVECLIDEVRAVKDSRLFVVQPGHVNPGDTPYVIINREFTACRIAAAHARLDGEYLIVPPETLQALGVEAGSSVRAVSLFVTSYLSKEVAA